MALDYVLFDLDGTITDSGPGITNAVAYALERMGIQPPPRRELFCFVGPPLGESFMKYFALSEREADGAIALYREYYRARGLFESELYPGIEEVFRALREAGAALAVATSKPEPFARQILEHFGLDRYFAYIGGSNFDGSRVDKAQVIEYVLGELGCTDRSGAVMVGDREHDVLGARRAGIPCVGVLFGYGSREELASAGAAQLAETAKEILMCCQNATKNGREAG